jgi:hypothetical protein
MAYSLLGVFGLFMPLLYGEGADHAFRRLRKAIKENQSEPLQQQAPSSGDAVNSALTASGISQEFPKRRVVTLTFECTSIAFVRTNRY